ncbi:MAG TPA: filamentous hemagglutinin N-terminal domain-containing protein [Gammaproteobacteria bacterium]|nr:filamentous hemagglutinin N-terminal domain-containing protein [Gammaproteobacteria bacterium]
MVVIISELEKLGKKINSQYKKRLRLGISGYAQLLLYSFLFSYPSFSYAGPAGGNIVGGVGHIHASGLTTDIHQTTASLAINWDSYNLSASEVVNYLQPSASSIALNRILSNSGSQILGQINANGQVVLVNPNGVFFGPTASVNVGGLIASGLDIKPTDFMNGNYVFSSIDGSSGAVINGGILNASLGGSIALIGQQVTNKGLISANLGAVSLAAGKEAVLTFDNEGLMGVKITKAVLQDELGVDPAILNSGEISAESGRVLLTASQSQDVFSQAVNSNGIEQATSVVVNGDGSFTLGGGAAAVNTGTVDVSATDGDAGQIVVLGENVSSSGTLKADSVAGKGGEIELHATDTTLLTGNSITSARSDTHGVGGDIKVLGNKVGLFDQSTVDVSGANGGGQALLGGDRKGENQQIRNAEFLYISEESQIKADALDNGNGGKIIAFSDNTSRVFGGLQARGGLNGGNGGFIETSGKLALEVTQAADASAINGAGGSWLIDPRDVDIVAAYTVGCSVGQCPDPLIATFSASVDNTEILASILQMALVNNSTGVSIDTGASGTQNGDITINADINYDGAGANSLTLSAANNIIFRADKLIVDGNPNTADSLNINLYANGDITLNNGVIIDTQGGNFTVGDTVNGVIPASFSSYNAVTGATATIDTSGIDYIDPPGFGNTVFPTDAGNINITTSGAVTINRLTAAGGAPQTSSNAGPDRPGRNGGNITINAGSVMANVNSAIDTRGSAGSFDTNATDGRGANGGTGGSVDITATSGGISVAGITTRGGAAAGNATDSANGGDAGTIDLTVSAGNTITLNGNLVSNGAIGYVNNGSGRHGNGAGITLTGDAILANSVLVDTLGFAGTPGAPGTDGAILFTGNIIADTNVDARTLELRSGVSDTTVTGSVGVGADNALQSFTISSAKDASLNAITTQSGGVSIAANTVSVAGIDTSNGGTPGAVNIIATELIAPSVLVPSITLNGDINAGANTAQLSLVSTSTGSVTVNYLSDFTSQVNVTGSAGTDTINAAARLNAWQINDAVSGDLNSTLRFINFETLNGGSGNDTLTAGAGINNWDITALNGGSVEGIDAGGASNGIYGFTGIENLVGNSSTDNFVLNGGTLSGTIDGGAGNDTLTGGAGTNNWDITALNEGNVIGVNNGVSDNFTDIESLVGNAGTDNFVLNGGTLSGTIDGGTGEDSLTAGDVANTWRINGANQGNVTGVDAGNLNGAYDFTGIENITGGILDDAVTFDSAGTISGVVDGGAENRNANGTLVGRGDTLNMLAVAVVDIVLGATPLSATAMNVVSMEEITGNDTDSTLTGQVADIANGNTINNWVLFDDTGAEAVVDDGTVSNENGMTKFINFTALQGSDRDDFFAQSGQGTFDMSIDGGSEQIADQLDFSLQLGSVVVDLNDTVNTTITDIEGVRGNDFDSTLIAKDGQPDANAWVISGNNDGTLNAGDPDGVIFTDFNILQGGDGADNFIVQNGGSVGDQVDPAGDLLSGISGGDGVDVLTMNVTSTVPTFIRFDGGNGNDLVTVNLNGNQNGSLTFNDATPNAASGDDTLVVQGGLTANYTEVYTPDVGAYDQLVYTDAANVFTVNYSNINNGTVNDNVSVDSLSVNGVTNAADTIVLNTGDFQVNANTQVNYDNKRSLLVDGLGGADTININSALNFAGNRVELTAQTITNTANDTFEIAATDLLLDTSTSIGNGNALIGDAANALRTNVTNLRLVGADGSVYIAEQNALDINELSNNNGTLNIAAGGTISSTADLQSTGNIDMSSAAGDVLLSSVNNRFSGLLSFSGNTVTLNNTVTTRLNNITAANFNAGTTAGSIFDIDAGTVQVTGLATLNAPLMVLNGPNLNLAGLEVNNSNIVLVNNSTNALDVTRVNASGLVDITSGELIATGDISGSSVTLRTGAAAATVNTLNATGAVTVLSTGLTATGDISGGAAFINAATGDVSFNSITANTGSVFVSGNDISQRGDITSENAVAVNSTDGFTMAVGTNTTVNNGGITVNATNLVALQTVNVANNVSINSSSGSVNFNALLNTAQGNITAVADRDVFVNGGLNGRLDVDLTATNGSYSQLAAINSTQGDINVTSGRFISMFTNSASTATAGNIQYTAETSVDVTGLSAAGGKIGISSNRGAVTDANGSAMNFVADTLEIRAVNGIGSTGQIETQVAKMDAINTGNGTIDFQQTGNVELVNLQNTGMSGNVVFSSDADINLNPNSVVAARGQGRQGLLTMQTTQGSFLGLQQSDLNNPDISAQDAIILVRNGSFGTLARPITMDVANSVLIDARILFEPRFVPPGPVTVNTNGVNFSLRGVVAAIASEQLVEVETLAEIDPAIFTDLQNYSSEEVSIRMPQDQLFEDELDIISKTEF